MSSLIGTTLFGLIFIMTILVAFGAPLGKYTTGGKYKILLNKLRIMACISFLVQVFAIIIVF